MLLIFVCKYVYIYMYKERAAPDILPMLVIEKCRRYAS